MKTRHLINITIAFGDTINATNSTRPVENYETVVIISKETTE
jgi:hypothetical protein